MSFIKTIITFLTGWLAGFGMGFILTVIGFIYFIASK